MTRAEQIRRFGSVIQPVEAPEVVLGAAGASISPDVDAPAPIRDCHLARLARKRAKWRAFRRSAINLIHGLCMGALLVGALVAGVYLGG